MGLKEITTIAELERVLGLSETIVYFLVEWSGPERHSRMIVEKIIKEENLTKPIYFIDYSRDSEVFNYWVKHFNESERKDFWQFYGGWGSLAFLSKESIVERISYVASLDENELRKKLKHYSASTSL